MSRLSAITARYVDDAAPDSVLLVGPSVSDVWEHLDLSCKPSIKTVLELDHGQLPRTDGPFDLVLVAGVIERLDRRAGGRLLATLRDFQARTLLVQIARTLDTDETSWSLADMLAFGFERLASVDEPQGTLDIYRFSLDDYKKTPDWLNPSNWAHPHLWKP